MGIPHITRRRLLALLTLLVLVLAVAVWAVTCDLGPAADPQPRPTITTEDSLATAVAFNEVWASAVPTPTAEPDAAESLPTVYCKPPGQEPLEGSAHFLHWTPDGSQLIFDLSDTIWAVDSRGTQVDVVVDSDPTSPEAGAPSINRFYADLSPDGSRLVYSTCEYPIVVPASGGSVKRHVYEIASADLAGGGRQRLTESQAFDSYPAWSPDGDAIAFLRSGGRYDDTWVYILGDGPVPSRWWLGGQDVEAALFPPAWSPNGESLALVGYESTSAGRRSCLYTGAARGPEVIQFRTTRSAVFRVTEATGPPSWSPDGKHLAFTRSGGRDAGVYVVSPGGTQPRRIVDASSQGPLWPSDVAGILRLPDAFVGSPVWSPDSTRLLFLTREFEAEARGGSRYYVPGRVFSVALDGGEIVELTARLPEFVLVTAAAWSQDGSRIAVSGDIREFPWSEYEVRRVIVTADPDGGDMRFLAVGDSVLYLSSGRYVDSVGGLTAWNAPGPGAPVDTAPCSEGIVVPNPQGNPGLVRDCETLLSIRGALAGRADLEWSGQVPISDWEGVTVGGEPLAVVGLRLVERGLTGVLPAELGRLSGLVELEISGSWLTGPIPTELGDLTQLEFLGLSSNYLSGGIPPELGALGSLRSLNLHGNVLSGSIPPALGSLANLEDLHLTANALEGPIPPELGMLERLSRLTLSGNRLSDGIPREIYGLASLTWLDLWGDGLTGCFAAEYPEILEEVNNEEACEPKDEPVGVPLGWGVLG